MLSRRFRKIPSMVRVFFLVLLILVLVGVYRSYVDNTAFLDSFDRVARTTIVEVWQVVTSPIGLTALVLFVGLWLSRGHLPVILSAITEIRAGTLSASFDASRLLRRDVLSSVDRTEENPQQVSEEALATLVKVLGVDFCWYLLKVANKSIKSDEHIRILQREVSVPMDLNPEGLIAEVYAMGYLVGVFANLDNYLFNLTGPSEEYVVEIRPQVLEQITRKLTANA